MNNNSNPSLIVAKSVFVFFLDKLMDHQLEQVTARSGGYHKGGSRFQKCGTLVQHFEEKGDLSPLYAAIITIAPYLKEDLDRAIEAEYRRHKKFPMPVVFVSKMDVINAHKTRGGDNRPEDVEFNILSATERFALMGSVAYERDCCGKQISEEVYASVAKLMDFAGITREELKERADRLIKIESAMKEAGVAMW